MPILSQSIFSPNSDPAQFERSVRDLLCVAGYDVQREVLLGYKKVDLFFEERRLRSKRRVVVKCKYYRSRLHQHELAQIYANYRPLFESNHVDEILLITLSGLSPSAQAMVDQTRELSHLTFLDLQSMLMDFRSYLAGLMNQFRQDGLSSYYIPLKTGASDDLQRDADDGLRISVNAPQNNTGNDLETIPGDDLKLVVLRWLKADSKRPLALLAGYGMGKTTFARRLSYILARRHLNAGRREGFLD